MPAMPSAADVQKGASAGQGVDVHHLQENNGSRDSRPKGSHKGVVHTKLKQKGIIQVTAEEGEEEEMGFGVDLSKFATDDGSWIWTKAQFEVNCYTVQRHQIKMTNDFFCSGCGRIVT